MENQTLLNLFKKYYKDEELNEATTTSTYRGSYKPPIRPGLTYWDPEDLQPYVDPLSKYVNAETNYDSLDGDIKKSKKEIAKKEKIAKKIQKKDFIQDSKDEGDDEYTKAPFKVLTPLHHKKGDKSGKNPRIKDEKHYSAPFTNSKINEADTSTTAGPYNGPISLSLKKWELQTLAPFIVHSEHEHNTKSKKKKIKGGVKGYTGHEEKDHPKKNTNTHLITPEEKTLKEDLAVWFGTKKKPKGSKQPKGPWVNICRKKEGGGHPPCGRPEADSKGYPKCRAAGVAAKMTDAQKSAACSQKRRAEKKEPKSGTGNAPTMVSYKPKKKNESILKSAILEILTKK